MAFVTGRVKVAVRPRLPIDGICEMLIKAQQNDPSLTTCFSSAVATEESRPHTGYFIENGVLMRRWSMGSEDLNGVDQVVVSNEQTYGTQPRT